MRARRVATAAAVLATAATAAVLVATGQGNADSNDKGSDKSNKSALSEVRRATAKYHDVATAKADGFGELKDKNGIACIVDPKGTGTMGIHYVKLPRVQDPAINADEPELVIYQPQKNGKLKLVAVEYVVVAQAWADAGHTKAPSLFGRTFTLVPEGNRYGLPDFFELHAWAWDHNKSGDFADYNPGVSCRAS